MATRLNTSLDDLFRSTPVGSIESSMGLAFYGINHRQTPSPIPINKDSYGLTFFTRPQLNMTLENLRADRKFNPLTTQEPASIQRIIRSTLDPRLHGDNITCPYVDPQMPFIPILTNHCTGVSGWMDQMLDTYTSKPGYYKEAFAMVDSTNDFYGVYDLTCTFRNMASDPITLLFQTWEAYQSNVFQGIMMPYFDYIIHNRLDYCTRIWRLVLDSTKTYVQKIGCTGASFPTTNPLSKSFDYQIDAPLNLSNNDITIQFKSMGACYNDPILIDEFNKCSRIFNSSMRDDLIGTMMKKIPYSLLGVFNNRGYPRISPETHELEWYVTVSAYNAVLAAYEKFTSAVTTRVEATPRVSDSKWAEVTSPKIAR
jgi:hypothetical protein